MTLVSNWKHQNQIRYLDPVSRKILKEYKVELSHRLANLLNKSHILGVVPESQRTANVAPILKNGDRSLTLIIILLD